ncbi:hypothetical protein T440DRAFT_445226 [Plenodomus tracheiphilus IPT5]|uniref:Telomere-associated protein Rif1 N-terminal domain-containing protein n=1 Tax=Plenodomus tracheiphilus IPT5 TaxID=1408161 RepID=A0A6A7BCZ0_9PLEO|nr:hypothetical protein T440DRAFT_445226 [Plenodomus tracheiphilus IPT5]
MVFSKFTSLSVRPPTPPKDLYANEDDLDETLRFLDDPFGDKPLPPRVTAAKAVLSTPEQSPSSDISIPSSSASRRKKVNFELQTCAIPNKNKNAITKNWTPTRSSPLRPLPQTRVSIPLKSILKPSDSTPTPPPADAGAAAHKFKTFAEMLESIVKLLASAERPSRLDAYHSLQRTMQAYDKVPDDQALKHKMTLLTQFIRRDVQAQSPTGTGLDSQLIAQALKLLMALFRITDLTSAMDDDFCSFIVDRIITVAGDNAMPKSVVNTHLAVCMQQNFRPKTMTVARVEKILDALDTIHERVSGFSVQAYRIRIYRKLIQQRPDVMIKYTERWFKLTVKALVASQKDINQSALDTCLAAAKTIGHDRHVAKSILTVLNRTRSDGESLANVMTQELERMLSGDNAALVPQIWSAVTGLLRDSLQGQLFSALKEWLKLFERCLRSQKEMVKVHANVAFCFLLYAVNLAPNTSPGWTSMFLGIPLQQLQQHIPTTKAERDATTSGYITLLYYAFRPTASFEQLDRYWAEFVANFWYPLVHTSSTQHTAAACRVVAALLNGSRKPWNEQRALELRPQYMTQRNELPLLDPRWVRRSLSLILKFVETLLEATPWSEKDQKEDEPVKTMWLAVLDALVEASSKEIMASSETKDAIAHIVNLLRRVWDSHTAKLAVPQQKEDLWANKFCFLIDTVVQKLGPSRFADKSLTRNSDNEFEVASTPTHRGRQQGARTSPLLYFTDLLINQSEGKLSDSIRNRAMGLMLEPCFDAQNTRLGRLELLRDCASSVNGTLQAAVAENFWAHMTELLYASIKESVSDLNERGSRPYGKEYEAVVELLSIGSAFISGTSRGEEVLSAFINTVRREAGEGAVILAVIEPVSERVVKRTPEEEKTACLPFVTLLLRNLPRQMSRRILEQGRQLLWPSSPATGRTTDFDPYNHLYTAVVAVGSAAYQQLDREGTEPAKAFIAAMGASIEHCSTSHLAVYLRKTQQVIATWVEDSEKKMQSKEPSLKALHREIINLWQDVNKAIGRLPRKDSQILLHLETLITSGFLSRRRAIVNISIVTWNHTFGKEERLRYPAGLEQALRRLHNYVELELPSLDLRNDDTDEEPTFYDSDTSIEETKSAFKSPRAKGSSFKVSKSARKSVSRSPAVPTPGGNRRVPTRNTPNVRLVHNDSQIQFEPIVSSPSNPFDQQSQVLTERQKEMVDRQKLTTGLFANMGATSPLPDEILSPMELHSDAPTADDYVTHPSRTTPLKAMAAMGPMDMFLGSSPTPHARKTNAHIESDGTSMATPTAVRAVDFAPNDNLGSSPPRFDKVPSSVVDEQTEPDVRVGSSFDCRQPESLQSFDEGTTIDEEALLAAEREAAQLSDVDYPDDTIMSELPSSTIDLQLTAQIDAELQVQEPNHNETDELAAESVSNFVDAASHQPSDEVDDSEGNDTEVATSSTSRVNDSFNKSPTKSTPKSEKLRRSSRHSVPSSPAHSAKGKKRSRTAGKKGKKEVLKEDPVSQPGSTQMDDDEDDTILDNIVVASPKKPMTAPPPKKSEKGRKRKSMGGSESPARIVVPETSRKTGMIRRSQSLLSQVENSQDFLVEDTPAPKRARGSQSQDVSEAKRTPSPIKNKTDAHSSQSKRLSHVQVTPKRSSELGSSVRGTPLTTVAAGPPDAEVSTVPDAPPEPVQEASPERTSQPATTPSRSFTERVILTPRSIINQLKSLKDYLLGTPQLVLGRDEEREIDDTLFDIRRQVFQAGLRGEKGADAKGKE